MKFADFAVEPMKNTSFPKIFSLFSLKLALSHPIFSKDRWLIGWINHYSIVLDHLKSYNLNRVIYNSPRVSNIFLNAHLVIFGLRNWILALKSAFFIFSGCNPPKMLLSANEFQIMSLHIELQQKSVHRTILTQLNKLLWPEMIKTDCFHANVCLIFC